MAALNPWDKYLPPEPQPACERDEWVVTAHGLPYIVTTDRAAAIGPTDGQARFCEPEIRQLKRAAGDRPLPRRLSWALHMIKTTLGGEVLSCWVDSNRTNG